MMCKYDKDIECPFEIPRDDCLSFGCEEYEEKIK